VAVSVRVSGAADLRALSRDLKQAGRKDLRRELFAGLNRATKPLRAEAKANALATLPATGGSARVTIVARPSARGGQFNPAEVDAGIVRHPTYDHAPTVSQHVRAGWFTKPMQAGADEVRHELVAGIEVVARKLAAG
jgi:hypothetical protein